MTRPSEPFLWEPAIIARAREAGLELTDDAARRLAAHAEAVLAANERLHLTTVVDPQAFIERHLGEAFEGAALLSENRAGVLADLGSGNGYPGIPMAVARPSLVPLLIESSSKKAAFLRAALGLAGCPGGDVRERGVTRAADLGDVAPIEVLVTRAMGGWERIVPKLVPRMTPSGAVLLWSTVDAEPVIARAAWKSLKVVARRRLPGRERSLIYLLEREP